MRALALASVALLSLSFLAVPVAADHPGSNLGMLRFVTDARHSAGLVDGLVHHQAEVELAFTEWESLYPDHVERFTIGKTSSGFDLLGIKITDEMVASDDAPTPEGTKYVIYLDGGHHGNEYLGVELVMYYLEEKLAQLAAGEQDAVAFFSTHEIYAVPIINVDGNSADTRKNSNQVDPNRNYPFQWGVEASDVPAAFDYHGPEPMSEDEVRANAEFGKALRPDLWITMHTGISEFYWPWGYTHEKSPDWYMFEALEEPFEAATNGRVDAMMAAELYLASGATDDYGYGEVGVPTFTFEVHEDQFIPVYGQPIPQMIQEQLAGLEFMVKNTKYLGARLVVETNPEANGGFQINNIGWGNATTVSVTFDGVDVTGADIIPAEYLVSLPTGTDILSLGIPAGATAVHVTYDPLYIDAAQPRTVSYTFTEADLATLSEVEASGPAFLVPLLAALGVALMMRRVKPDA